MPNVTGGNRDKFGGSAQAGGNSSGGRGGAGTGRTDTKAKAVDTPASMRMDMQGNVDKGLERISAAKAASIGGTTAQPNPSPGSVPVLDSDLPDTLTNIGKAAILGPLGAAGYVAGNTVVDGQAPDPFKGEQVGYQPDRFKGRANLDGVGDPGSASGLSADERALIGQPYGAGAMALTGDSEEPASPGVEAIWSDATLQDRRKPKKDMVGAGTQMVLG